MASQSLLVLVAAYLKNDLQGLRARFVHPVMVWEPPRPVGDLIDVTDATGASRASSERSEPVVIEAVKRLPNGYPFGVTIGHAENNDVVLRHHLVSRFHAYVKAVRGQHCLVDAASRNGTWLDARRLEPTVPTPLPPQATLRLGGPEITWLEPSRLIDWLAARVEAANASSPPAWARDTSSERRLPG